MDFGVELAIAKYNEGIMLMREEYKLWPGLCWEVKESQVDAAEKGSAEVDFCALSLQHRKEFFHGICTEVPPAGGGGGAYAQAYVA